MILEGVKDTKTLPANDLRGVGMDNLFGVSMNPAAIPDSQISECPRAALIHLNATFFSLE